MEIHACSRESVAGCRKHFFELPADGLLALRMRRCEVSWAELPRPAGCRPVVLISRNEAYTVRELVTVAPITTRMRGIPVEVQLARDDGLPRKQTLFTGCETTKRLFLFAT